MIRLSPMKIPPPLSLAPAGGTLRLDSQHTPTSLISRGIQGIALLDWKPQINVRVPRNSGMLARLARLKAMAIQAATRIQEQKFQLQMMRQNHQRALVYGLEVDGNNFLPLCDETARHVPTSGYGYVPTTEEISTREPEDVKDCPAEEEVEQEEVAPKCEVSFNIECAMKNWEPVSMSKGSIVFDQRKHALLETLCP